MARPASPCFGSSPYPSLDKHWRWGLTLSWTRALGEFGATILFAGSLSGRTQTMPLLVYNVLERDIDAAIWTGLILVAIALVALAIMQWLARQTTGHL